MLKNGVDRYNIFFNFYTKLAESSFLCRIRQCFGLCHVLFFQQTISHMRKCFTECGHCVGRMNAWILCGFFTGFKKIKQQHISFVLGYLRMLLWKISTAISIKHRILTTFDIKKIQFWQPLSMVLMEFFSYTFQTDSN